jgi:hypothetical protein
MSVGAITSAFTGYAQKATSASSGAGGGTPSSALQEATETSAQTAQEARNGDRVAIKKLKLIQNQKTHAAAPEPGKGQAVDHKA